VVNTVELQKKVGYVTVVDEVQL